MYIFYRRATGKAKAGQKSASATTTSMDVDGVITNTTSTTTGTGKPKNGSRKPRTKVNTSEDKERKPGRKKEKEVIIIPDEITSEQARSTSSETEDNQAITRESTVGMEMDTESDFAKAKRKNSKVNVEDTNMDTNSGTTEPDKKRRKQVLVSDTTRNNIQDVLN
jgi:hypothetical protein